MAQKDYLKLGYVPLTHHESVNHTLDYAFSDYCISQVAKQTGDKEISDCLMPIKQKTIKIFLILKLVLCEQKMLTEISELIF